MRGHTNVKFAEIVDYIAEFKLERSKTRADWEKSIKKTKVLIGL
jgi:thioredoxin-related protein